MESRLLVMTVEIKDPDFSQVPSKEKQLGIERSEISEMNDRIKESYRSTWIKSEDRMISFPAVVKYYNGVTRLYNTKIGFEQDKQSDYWEIKYYLLLPPIPEIER
jgi:hypothetical protein